MGVDIKVLRTHPAAQMPVYATPGAMCFDLRVCAPDEAIIVNPGERRLIGTGLSFEMPYGWGMNVFSRSGQGHILGISLSNGTGKIDPDYRGEVRLSIENRGMHPVTFNHGDRIAQAEPIQVHIAYFTEVQALSGTERGCGGFGSTGSKE